MTSHDQQIRSEEKTSIWTPCTYTDFQTNQLISQYQGHQQSVAILQMIYNFDGKQLKKTNSD